MAIQVFLDFYFSARYEGKSIGFPLENVKLKIRK